MSLRSDPQMQSRSRAGSNPWVQYSDFFTNSSFLIPDTVAFTKILPYFKALPAYTSRFNIRLVELVGYEAYFVEQWISSRSSDNLIVTYTGDQNDRLIAYHVQSLSEHMQLQPPPHIHEPSKSLTQASKQHLPYDNWPPKFISYLVEQLESPFCVATETSLGYAFITNLTQLNPFLSLIAAKTGNIADDYDCYVVNYNLRKLGCGSRSATTTDEPSKSMEDKFKNTFKIDSKVAINYAAVDLILITQTFLYYYGLLDPLYCDGLLCERTEAAIIEWWKLISEIPMALHVIRLKPPTCHTADSIQAIIGFTVLCRYLLELGGNNFSVPKDPMDVKKFKAAISKFQKHSKLEPTSKFNLETLLKLMDWGQNNKVSQNLTKDLSKMKNLVKNTVIDITSGKNLQIIAHNATASPFYLHSHSVYDHSKLINCQNIDHIKHMPLGKQLSYLFFASGKPVDFNKESLSIQVIKKVADSTTNNSLIDGVKHLKSQLSIQSFQTHKSHSNFLDIKGLSATTLNLFDREHDQDTDTELSNERRRLGSDAEIDEVLSNSNEEYNDNALKSHKKKKRSASSVLFSSEDESPTEKNENNRSTSLADFDYDDYNNDVAIYNPTKNRINSNTNKANSLGAAASAGSGSDNGYDNYADYDGDYTNDYNNDDDYVYYTQNGKTNGHGNRGTSFSSHVKLPLKNIVDMNNIDEALIDDGFSDSEYNNKSNLNSSRNTDNPRETKLLLSKELKNLYTPPRMISSTEVSRPNSMLSSVNKTLSNRQHLSRGSSGNGYDSDGIYEYENGFEYDYELDPDHHQNYHNRAHSHSRKHSYLASSKEHSRRPSSLILSNINSTNEMEGESIAQDNTAFSTQTNLTSSNGKNESYEYSASNIDLDYLNFMKRIKRRHSIPIVEPELNKYSIEMKMKMKRDKIENSLNNNLERKVSWSGSRRSVWDRASLSSANTDDDANSKNANQQNLLHDIKTDIASNNNLESSSFSKMNGKDTESPDQNGSNFLYRMKRKQSIFGAQSIHTNNSSKMGYVPMDTFIIYHKPSPPPRLRKSQSFSSLESSLMCAGKGTAVSGFEFSDVSFLTSEVLAMKYLKLEANYQIEVVQGSFSLTKDLQLYSRYLLESINSNPNTCVSLMYNTTRNDVKKVVGKYFELEDKLKNTVKSNARLKYELRLLLQKTKEVENNLKTLQDFKIKTLNSKIDSMISDLAKHGRGEHELKGLFLEDSNLKESSSSSKKINGNYADAPIVDRLYADDGNVDWDKLSIKNIWNNPYIMIYLLFHFMLCTVMRRVDAEMIEQRWKEIDKNQTVTMMIRKLFNKSERELHKEEEEAKKNLPKEEHVKLKVDTKKE